MSAHYLEKANELAGMIKPADYVLAEETIPVVATILEAVNDKHGPESDDFFSFHNAEHGIDVIRRGIWLGNIFEPYLTTAHRNRFYDAIMVVGAGHDIFQRLGTGRNEIASSDFIQEQVAEADGALNTGLFMQRVRRGTLATTVVMEPDGKLVQINLQKGARDPIKPTMGFADINGIAMEGIGRMIKDGMNLSEEFYENPTVDERCDFLYTQDGFMRQRVNDYRIKGDLAYCFPDDHEEIYKVLRKTFRGKILASKAVAEVIHEIPQLHQGLASVYGHGRDGAMSKKNQSAAAARIILSKVPFKR